MDLGWGASYPPNENFDIDNNFPGNGIRIGPQMITGSFSDSTEHNFTDFLQMPSPNFRSEFPHLSTLAANAIPPEEIIADPLGWPFFRSDALLDERHSLPNADLGFEQQAIELNLRGEDLELHLGPALPEQGVSENTANLDWMNLLNPVAMPSGESEHVVGDNDQNISRKRPRESEIGTQQTRNVEQVVSVDDDIINAVGASVCMVRRTANRSHQASNHCHEILDLPPPNRNGDHGNIQSLFSIFQFAVNLIDLGHADGSLVDEPFRIFFGDQTFEPALTAYGHHVSTEGLLAMYDLGAAGQGITFADKVYLLTGFLEASRGLFLRFSRQLEAFYLLSTVEQDWILRAPDQGGFWLGFYSDVETFCSLPPSGRGWVVDHMNMVTASEAPNARQQVRRRRRTIAQVIQNDDETERTGNLDDMRVDIDGMSYEEILANEERIGTVETGLSEGAIISCINLHNFEHFPLSIKDDIGPCVICQEDYDGREDVGKLPCGHHFHLDCIKPWLLRKNSCPICKAPVLAP
ncbi:hypothetical protein Dimus_017167 [Dionaea muscipula]